MSLPCLGIDERQITVITPALQPEENVHRPQSQCWRGL
jgi:hypothetical protein